jgi:hypothetical protein
VNVNVAETPEATEALDRLDYRERLWVAAEQLRLAAVALNGMGRARLDGVTDLDGHIARLEHRSAELMRSAARLGEALGLSAAWGLDILFQPVERTLPARPVGPAASTAPAALAGGGGRRKVRSPYPKRMGSRGRSGSDPMNESIELAPIELLAPDVPPPEPRRRIARAFTTPPGRPLPPLREGLMPAPLGDGEA